MEIAGLADADPALSRQAQELAGLDRQNFRRAIHALSDDELADVRYLLGYRHPDGTQWPVWDINRLLTKRKASRERLPQWIGIIASFVTSVAALIVSIAG